MHSFLPLLFFRQLCLFAQHDAAYGSAVQTSQRRASLEDVIHGSIALDATAGTGRLGFDFVFASHSYTAFFRVEIQPLKKREQR